MLHFCNPDTEIQAIIDSGAAFYSRNRVSNIREERFDDGTIVLRAKAIDAFNFVSHPAVTVDPVHRLILSCVCDCGESKLGLCRHGVALLLSIGEEIDLIPAAEQDRTPSGEPAKEITVRVIHEHNSQRHAHDTEAAEEKTAEPLASERKSSEPEEPIQAESAETDETPEQTDKNQGESVSSLVPHRIQFIPPGIQVQLGSILRTGDPLEWTPNDTERLFHTNTGIIGTMGTGKTQLTKSIICQFMRNAGRNYGGDGLGVLIFDYKGDYNETKEDFIKATGAKVLKPYRIPYNPLALIAPPTFKPLLPIHTANAFVDILTKIYRLGPKQQNLLLDCIRIAYDECGIDPNKPETWKRVPPTFAKVHEIFSEETEGRSPDSLTSAVNKLYDFRIFDDSRISSGSIRDLMSGVVVMDLSGYDQNIQNLVVAITLELFYAQMLTLGSSKMDDRYRQMRQLILVDEADNFMSKDFPALRRILKEGREFGVGTILSTQSLSHFITGSDNYSRYIFSWVVHATIDLKQKDVEYIFKLPPKSGKTASIYSTIKKLEKHQSVVKLANDDPVTIMDLPFWKIAQGQS